MYGPRCGCSPPPTSGPSHCLQLYPGKDPLPTSAKGLNPTPQAPEVGVDRAGPHQLLEGGLVQVTLEGKLAEGFPRRLVRLHLDCAALHSTLMADRAARHEGRPSQSLEALRDKRKWE